MPYLIVTVFYLVILAMPILLCIGLVREKMRQRSKADIPAKAHPTKVSPSTTAVSPPHVPPAGWNPTPAIVLTQKEITGKSAKGQLRDSEMMKELLKTRDPVEADVIKMVQAGATLADIKRRHGKEVAAQAQTIKDKAMDELEAKITPMVQAGMTMEQIVEKLRPHGGSVPTDSPSLPFETTWIPHSNEGQQMPTAQPDKPARRRKASKLREPTLRSIVDSSPALEGGRKPKTNYAVVRSAKLKKAAIEIHGRNCCACTKNFDEIYGPDLAKGYVEIHHLNKIAAGERTTDPATDLAPLCSNCHTMADRLSPPPRTIAELRYRLFPGFRLQEKEVAPAAEADKSPVKIRIGKIREKKPKKGS